MSHLRLQHLGEHGLVAGHANVSRGARLLVLGEHDGLVLYLVLVVLAFSKDPMYLLPVQAEPGPLLEL